MRDSADAAVAVDLGGLELFVLDGGSMTFEVARPGRRLELTLALRPILLRAEGFSCLVDPGFGPADPERRVKFRLRDPEALEHQCARLGLLQGPDHVYLTHLHFDHAGGVLAGASSSATQEQTHEPKESLRFERTRIWTHSAEWREAIREERGGRLAQRIAEAAGIDAAAPERAGRHDGSGAASAAIDASDAQEGELWQGDGVSLRYERTRGHTGGLCVLWCEGRHSTALFAADLLPSRRFLEPRLDRVADQDPELARDERAALLGASCRARRLGLLLS